MFTLSLSLQASTFAGWTLLVACVIAYVTHRVVTALVPPIKALRRFLKLVLADDLSPDVATMEQVRSVGGTGLSGLSLFAD